MSVIHVIFRNMMHRKYLTLLTVLSVTATVAFIVILSLSRASVEQGAKKGYGPFDIAIGREGSETQLILNTFYHVGAPTGNIPGEVLDQVADHPAVEKAYAITTGDSYNDYPIVGIEPEYFLTRYGDRKLDEGQLYRKSGEVIIGAYAARMLGVKVGDTFIGAHGLSGDMGHEEEAGHEDEGNPGGGEHVEEEYVEGEHAGEDGSPHEEDEHAQFTYTVTGILPELGTPDDRAVFTTIDYAWAVHGETGEDREITAILMKPKTLLAAQEIRNLLDQESGVQVIYTSKAVADVVNLVDRGSEILLVVTWLCVILAAISILLSLISAAGERTKDVGLLRLLGKPKSYVWMTLLGEGILITVTGLILGLAAGHAGVYMLQDVIFEYAGIQIQPFEWSSDHALIAVVTVGIGLAASLGPAFRLYRTDPLTLFKS